MSAGDDDLAVTERLLGIGDLESHSLAIRHEMVEEARRLGVREVILGVRARLDDEDPQRGVRIRKTSGDETARRAACGAV